jgi:hypothetical protein
MHEPVCGHQSRLQSFGVYGLTLVSDLPLKIPRAAADSGLTIKLIEGVPDKFREVGEQVIGDPEDWSFQALQPSGVRYERWGSYFEIVSFPRDATVVYRNLSGSPLESFEAYLTNFAVSAALIQLGEEPLHATVVEVNDHAIGLLGGSGAGKSTLAAVLVDRGAVLITDDMLRLTLQDSNAYAHHGPYRIKLFQHVADRYLPRGTVLGQWSFPDKRVFRPPNLRYQQGPRPLLALVHLAAPSPPANNKGPVLERLVGMDLFQTILSSSMNSRLHTPDRLQRLFHFGDAVARTVPVYRLTYRRDFSIVNQVAACVEEICVK